MHNPHPLQIDLTVGATLGSPWLAVALSQDTPYSKNYGAICAVIPENSEHGFRPTKPLFTPVKHLKHLLSQKRHHPLRQPLVGTMIAHTNNGLVAIDANGGRAYFSSLL